MSALLKVIQGGKLRVNRVVNASTTYSRGQAVYINSTGTLVKYDGIQGANVGLALETAVTTATGNPKNDTGVVVQGKTGSILLGEALVQDDNISGVGIAVGDSIYAASGGNLTNVSGLGTWRLGKSTRDASSDGVAEFQMRPDF